MEQTLNNPHRAQSKVAARPVRREVIPSGLLAMSIFLITEVMLFAGFISAFIIVKGKAVGGIWPPVGQPLLPAEQTAINTVALLISGVALITTEVVFRRNQKLSRLPFVVSLVLGAWFVVAQGLEWVALLEQGLTLTSSAHGAFFYTIVGLHGIHAVVSLGILVWCFAKLLLGTMTPGQLWTGQAFWYFVVGIWPVIYWQVYL